MKGGKDKKRKEESGNKEREDRLERGKKKRGWREGRIKGRRGGGKREKKCHPMAVHVHFDAVNQRSRSRHACLLSKQPVLCSEGTLVLGMQ